jgi:hypothetical protein
MAELNRMADALRVHPRTILRALAGKVNTYWAPGHNPNISVEEVAKTMGMPPAALKDALNGNDMFLTPEEAAEELGIPLRTFRYRRYPAQVRKGTAVRYSLNLLTEYQKKHYS